MRQVMSIREAQRTADDGARRGAAGHGGQVATTVRGAERSLRFLRRTRLNRSTEHGICEKG